MPRRSTPFQKLVHHIQEQLGEGAIEESAMLRHRLTGKEREVDIVLRGQVGEHPVTVSVECIERGRPADVGWVEEMKTKHEHLETDRLVLVSRAGFSSQALTLATSLNIAAYAPEDAQELDWTHVVWLDRLFVTRYDFVRKAVWVLIGDRNAPDLVEAGADTLLQDVAGAPRGTLGVLVDQFLRSGVFSTRAMDKMTDDCSGTVSVDFWVHDEIFAVDTDGRPHRVLGFRAKVRAVRKTGPVDLTSLSWRGTPAAFGQARTPLGDTTLTFIEKGPQDVDARMFVDGRKVDLKKPPGLKNDENA